MLDVVCLQGMSDLCVNPKATVNYYISDKPALKGKYILFDMFFFIHLKVLPAIICYNVLLFMLYKDVCVGVDSC